VPNDPNAAQIVGYGEGINPMTFRIDDERGTIVAPTSIGHLITSPFWYSHATPRRWAGSNSSWCTRLRQNPKVLK
jgi:hypothetical protein